MKTIQIFEGSPFEGVVAYAVPAVGAFAVRSRSGPCELVAVDGSVVTTAPTLTALCFYVRILAPGPFVGEGASASLAAAVLRSTVLGAVTASAPALLADVVEELTGESLLVLPKSRRVVSTIVPDPERGKVFNGQRFYEGQVDHDPTCGATTVYETVDARPGSMTVFFPDGRPLELYPDHEEGWTPPALFKVATRLAGVVHPKSTARSTKLETARSSLHGVCVYRIGGTVGEHIVAPGEDNAPAWSFVHEERPSLDAIDVLEARVNQLVAEVGSFSEAAQFADWDAELRARAHERAVTWPTLEDRLILTRMEAQRFGLDDVRVWTELDRSRPLSTPKLRDVMKEVSRRTQPIVSKLPRSSEGIAMLVGQSVFGRPSIDDLEHVYAERNRGETLYRHELICDIEPLRPALLGTVAGVDWGTRLARAVARTLAELSEVSAAQTKEDATRPLAFDVRPLLELFPLCPALTTADSGRATAIFAALARGDAARGLGQTALRVTRRAPGVHAADAWAYAVLVAVVEQLGMWRPAVISVPRPWDYLPALLALDNGYRYVSDRKYDSSASGFGLESYIGGKMPAAEKP